MKQTDFDNYIENFKKLPLQKKKVLANSEMKKILAFIEKAKNDLSISDKILLNKEILDLNSDNISDEDFVEAIFVYAYSIQESLGKYFNEISKKIYK